MTGSIVSSGTSTRRAPNAFCPSGSYLRWATRFLSAAAADATALGSRRSVTSRTRSISIRAAGGISRAGPGTKVVCLGNIAQIDTPYLTEGSSGLTYVVDRFKGWAHSGHVTLMRGERSRLADHAAEIL